MSKQSATAAATLDAAPEAADPAATRDYIVLRGQLQKGSDTYATGSTVPLTEAEAAHPLRIGVVRLAGIDTGKAGKAAE